MDGEQAINTPLPPHDILNIISSLPAVSVAVAAPCMVVIANPIALASRGLSAYR